MVKPGKSIIKQGCRKGHADEAIAPERVVPTMKIYQGTFVHSTFEDPIIVLKDWLIVVDNGKVRAHGIKRTY